MRISRDTWLRDGPPWLLPELLGLCYDFAESALWGVLCTVPNVMRCADALILTQVSAQTEVDPHDRSHTVYKFPQGLNARHIQVRCAVANTRVNVFAGSNSLLSLVVPTAHEWVEVGPFVGYNVLFLSALFFQGVQLGAPQVVDITYEQVQALFTPEDFPYSVGTVFQEISRGAELMICRYRDYLCGRVFEDDGVELGMARAIVDECSVRRQHEPRSASFYRTVDNPDQSCLSVSSYHITPLWTALRAVGIECSDWLIFTSPPTGSCGPFPNSRCDELLDIVVQIDPTARVCLKAEKVPQYDADLERRERERCAKADAVDEALMARIQAHLERDPPCFASVEAYETYRASATPSNRPDTPPNRPNTPPNRPITPSNRSNTPSCESNTII